ncbi:MAG: DUF421 domain-containing protein [Syntrophomonadaceae bacterium]|nr:DUF421 domain-containing protein [Syntrophomonadaceae bacterium]
MAEFVLRAVGMYFLAMLAIRFMGKRALGELGLFDFVVMTGVGHTLTSIALDQSLPFYEGIAVLATLAGLEYLLGYASLKNQRLARLISGVPVVLIDNGRIVRENLAREHFNVDDLMQELRKQGIRDVYEVEKGILEPCGGFSVILKQDAEPVTRGDVGLNWEPSAHSILTLEQEPRQKVFQQCWEKGQEGEETSGVSLPRQAELLQEILNRLDDISRRLPQNGR